MHLMLWVALGLLDALVLLPKFCIGSKQTPILPGKPLPDDPLNPFGVSQPLLTPFPPPPADCTQRLIDHSFAFSFGLPAVTQYVPPSESDCGKTGSWTRVVLTFRATSNGVSLLVNFLELQQWLTLIYSPFESKTQFDRLSSIYLQGVEIWRTSTPEPSFLGIDWTTQKDITRYKSLLSKNGTLVLDLANLLDASLGLNGIYDVTLDITFVPSSSKHPSANAADIILPLSLRADNSTSIFLVPPSAVTVSTFPLNAVQAFAEIYASGDSLEEFWYGNVPDKFFSQLPPWNAPDGQANPHGPFREVQLLIDGTLAGVVFPYPVIYSGEFLPSIWRPMVSYGAFDSPTYYIDITPFIPSLSDSRTHNFTLLVVSQETDHVINSDWILTGNLQIFVGSSPKPTTGKITRYSVTPFADTTVRGTVTGSAPDVSVTTTGRRTLTIEGELLTGSGEKISSIWNQDLTFSNSEIYATSPGNLSTQKVTQSSAGCSLSTHSKRAVISDCFQYPFELFLTFQTFFTVNPLNQTFFDYGVHLNHSYVRNLNAGPSVNNIATNIHTIQRCDGTQSRHKVNETLRTGDTSEDFSYVDSSGETYFRTVEVATFVNGTVGIPTLSLSSVLRDEEKGSLAL